VCEKAITQYGVGATDGKASYEREREYRRFHLDAKPQRVVRRLCTQRHCLAAKPPRLAMYRGQHASGTTRYGAQAARYSCSRGQGGGERGFCTERTTNPPVRRSFLHHANGPQRHRRGTSQCTEWQQPPRRRAERRARGAPQRVHPPALTFILDLGGSVRRCRLCCRGAASWRQPAG
jgi:hypothetical protein